MCLILKILRTGSLKEKHIAHNNNEIGSTPFQSSLLKNDKTNKIYESISFYANLFKDSVY